MRVSARAPLCLVSLGGWTASPSAEYGMVFTCAGEPCVEATVRARVRGVVVQAADALPRPLVFIARMLARAAAQEFALDGVEITLTAAPIASSLPSVSTAMTVALTAALAQAAEVRLSPRRLAWVAHRLRGDTLGEWTGLDGILASVTGGIALHRLEPYPRALSEALPIEHGEALEQRLLQVYTGRLPAAQGLRRVAERCWGGDQTMHRALWRLRALPACAGAALQSGDYTALGTLMEEHTLLQERLVPALRTPELCRIRRLAADAGAACLLDSRDGRVLLLVSPAHRPSLLLAVQQLGYAAAPVRVAREGARAWRDDVSLVQKSEMDFRFLHPGFMVGSSNAPRKPEMH